MAKAVKRSIAFQGEVLAGLVDLAKQRNHNSDGPKVTVNFLVNQACRKMVAKVGEKGEAVGKSG